MQRSAYFHVEIEQSPFLAFLVGPTNILAAWSDMLSWYAHAVNQDICLLMRLAPQYGSASKCDVNIHRSLVGPTKILASWCDMLSWYAHAVYQDICLLMWIAAQYGSASKCDVNIHRSLLFGMGLTMSRRREYHFLIMRSSSLSWHLFQFAIWSKVLRDVFKLS